MDARHFKFIHYRKLNILIDAVNFCCYKAIALPISYKLQKLWVAYGSTVMSTLFIVHLMATWKSGYILGSLNFWIYFWIYLWIYFGISQLFNLQKLKSWEIPNIFTTKWLSRKKENESAERVTNTYNETMRHFFYR